MMTLMMTETAWVLELSIASGFATLQDDVPARDERVVVSINTAFRPTCELQDLLSYLRPFEEPLRIDGGLPSSIHLDLSILHI